jgi:hypothetical protein
MQVFIAVGTRNLTPFFVAKNVWYVGESLLLAAKQVFTSLRVSSQVIPIVVSQLVISVTCLAPGCRN